MPAKLPVNDRFFEEITTEEQAYFLGLLVADGAVVDSYIKLEVAAQDADIVHKLKRALGAEQKLSGRPGTIALQFSSVRMRSDLARYGVVQNKSLIATMPAMPPQLARHFWRGMVDGDGWLKSRPARVIGLVGTSSLVQAFIDFCVDLGTIVPAVNLNGPLISTNLCGDNAALVVQTLYGDATVYLDRKHALAQEILRFVPEVPKTTRYHGVSRHGPRGFVARCRDVYLGFYRTAEDAARAYDEYVLAYGLNRTLNNVGASDATDV